MQPCSSSVSPEENLLDRARGGDQEAWRILFEECYPKILRVIRCRLSRSLRKYYDSTDIANEVMTSLAAKFGNFDFSTIQGLRAFLIQAAERKVVDGHRHGHAKKRDLDRDRPLAACDEVGGWALADGSPTASQVAVATEEEELLLEGQDVEGRQILEMRLQGFSNSDIARETGLHKRKIERFLERLRSTWRL